MYGYSFLLAICGDIRSNHYWSLNMCESPWEEELLIVIVFLLSYSCTLICLVPIGLLFSWLIFPFGVFLYSLSSSKHLFPHKVIGGLVVFQKMAIFGTLCVLSSRSHYWKSLPGFSIRSTSFLSFFFFYSFSPSITGCGV